MAPVINTVDRHGLSNEARCELLPRETKVRNAVLAVHVAVLHSCTLLTRQSFKSGCAMRVVKLLKEDWLTVLI